MEQELAEAYRRLGQAFATEAHHPDQDSFKAAKVLSSSAACLPAPAWVLVWSVLWFPASVVSTPDPMVQSRHNVPYNPQWKQRYHDALVAVMGFSYQLVQLSPSVLHHRRKWNHVFLQALSCAMDLAPTNKAVCHELQQVKNLLTLEQLAQVPLIPCTLTPHNPAPLEQVSAHCAISLVQPILALQPSSCKCRVSWVR